MRHSISMLLFYQIVEIAMAATNLSARHQGRTAESHSLADIDAVIARDPTLIFNIPEFVAEDDDLLLSDKGSSVPMPYSSEPNLHAGFIRWEAEEDHQIQKQAKEVKGSRLKQANREQVSAWLVNKRNAEGQKPSPSPSPSSKPSDGRTAVVLFEKVSDAKITSIPTPLAFDLHLFGRSFAGSELFISPNGYVRLSQEGDISEEDGVPRQDLPVPSLGTYLIFPYWTDIYRVSDDVEDVDLRVDYTFSTSAVTIDWRITPAYGLCHFQLTYCTNRPNYVEFAYMEDSNGECLNGESATIGVQSADGAYQFPTFKKNSVTPGMTLMFDTMTGDVDLYFT